jgi:acetyl-CoA/propionyl-CoA carboxylase biotin carboxyl carrier protein
MAYGDKLDGGGDDLDAGSAGAQSTGNQSTGTRSTGTPSAGAPSAGAPSAGTPSAGTQPTGNYWPAGEDYWPAAEAGSRRLGDAGSGEPDEVPYDYEDGQP